MTVLKCASCWGLPDPASFEFRPAMVEVVWAGDWELYDRCRMELHRRRGTVQAGMVFRSSTFLCVWRCFCFVEAVHELFLHCVQWFWNLFLKFVAWHMSGMMDVLRMNFESGEIHHASWHINFPSVGWFCFVALLYQFMERCVCIGRLDVWYILTRLSFADWIDVF